MLSLCETRVIHDAHHYVCSGKFHKQKMCPCRRLVCMVRLSPEWQIKGNLCLVIQRVGCFRLCMKPEDFLWVVSFL